jgi:hypothetical protein
MGSVDKGRKEKELIVLLCTINVRMTPKQIKGDPGFTADVTSLRGFSPWANCAGRANAACRRS